MNLVFIAKHIIQCIPTLARTYIREKDNVHPAVLGFLLTGHLCLGRLANQRTAEGGIKRPPLVLRKTKLVFFKVSNHFPSLKIFFARFTSKMRKSQGISRILLWYKYELNVFQCRAGPSWSPLVIDRVNEAAYPGVNLLNDLLKLLIRCKSNDY